MVVGQVVGKLGATVFRDHPSDGFALGEVASPVGFLADERLCRFARPNINVIEHEQMAEIVAVHLLAVSLQSKWRRAILRLASQVLVVLAVCINTFLCAFNVGAWWTGVLKTLKLP